MLYRYASSGGGGHLMPGVQKERVHGGLFDRLWDREIRSARIGPAPWAEGPGDGLMPSPAWPRRSQQGSALLTDLHYTLSTGGCQRVVTYAGNPEDYRFPRKPRLLAQQERGASRLYRNYCFPYPPAEPRIRLNVR